MTISDAQFTAWLKDQSAQRCVLVEVDIGLAAGGTTTRYLSNMAYVTSPTDTPANTAYLPRINTNVLFTRTLALDGTVQTTYGDLELTNVDGALDSWIMDYWATRPMRIYVGDVRWARSDFRLAFTGVTTGTDTQVRDAFYIQISDKLQQINVPVTAVVLGGTTSLANNLQPILFGECHNITPLLVDGTINRYQVHQGAIERIIEVRDNGAPVGFTEYLSTGYFDLENQPVGTITCSVQGALVPAYLLFSNDTLINFGLQGCGVVSTVPAVATDPHAGSVISLAATTYAGEHYAGFGLASMTGSSPYTASVFFKQGNSRFAVLRQFRFSSSYTTQICVILDFTTGTWVDGSDPGSTVNSVGATYVGNGWWRLWIGGHTNDTSATAGEYRIQFTDAAGNYTTAGDGSTVGLYITGAQFETGTYPTAYVPGSALGVPVYRNTISEVVRLLCTTQAYGTPGLQFTLNDIDIPSFVAFECQHKQPVGVYLSDKENILDICNNLASSVQGTLVVDTNGKVGLVQLSLPQSLPGTSIGDSDILDKSLYVSAVVPVQAGVVLGYCQNWTVQATVAGGLDAASAALFDQEWLTVTRSDSAAAANYNLYTTPTQVDTSLIVGTDAINEANRRLNMFKTQRRVFTYTGFYHLIFENLGAPQTITNARFGLSGGVTGQVISIAVDFMSPHIVFEVLI